MEIVNIQAMMEDRISEFPDHILNYILSLMKLREAAATSALSRRWRYLWTSRPCLIFESYAAIRKIEQNERARPAEVEKFITWVNQVFKSHQGPALQELSIYFDLDEDSKHAIDSWLEFAFSRKIEKIFLEFMYRFDGTGERYSVPNFHNMNHCSLAGFTTLREVSLCSVNVTQEAAEYLLYNCPALEYFGVCQSKDLVGLRVVGPSLKLRYLSIHLCVNLGQIELCNTKISSFDFSGTKNISLQIQNAPYLVELSLFQNVGMPVSYTFGWAACCFSQLESLNLNIWHEESLDFGVVPTLPKLRKLRFSIYIRGDRSLLELVPLIRECSSLKRVLLQLNWRKPSIKKREIKSVRCPLHHLECLELKGYYGSASDFELATFFIENAVALKRLIIEPYDSFFTQPPVENMPEIQRVAASGEIKEVEGPESRAKQLKEKITPQVEFTIKSRVKKFPS